MCLHWAVGNSSTGSCQPEVNKRIGLAYGVTRSLDGGVWRSRYLSRGTKLRVFSSIVLPVLLYSCEAWTLTLGLRRRLDSFMTTSLRRILGYRWQDRVSNARVFLIAEAGMVKVMCQIRDRQLRYFGHVARLSDDDSVSRVLPVRVPVGWGCPLGRPHSSWLAQLRPRGWTRRVGAAKCLPGMCPMSD